jgi:hypothetical protein
MGEDSGFGFFAEFYVLFFAVLFLWFMFWMGGHNFVEKFVFLGQILRIVAFFGEFLAKFEFLVSFCNLFVSNEL